MSAAIRYLLRNPPPRGPMIQKTARLQEGDPVRSAWTHDGAT